MNYSRILSFALISVFIFAFSVSAMSPTAQTVIDCEAFVHPHRIFIPLLANGQNVLPPQPTQRPPTAASCHYTITEDMPGNLDLTLAVSDPNNDPLTLSILTAPSHGNAAFTGKVLSYTPAPDYFGADSLTYLVQDGHGGSAEGTISITVLPVNDPPQVSLEAVPAVGVPPFTVTFTATATDPDPDVLSYSWDFGDGTTAPGTTQAVITHEYTGLGSFTASIQVSDGQENASTSQSIFSSSLEAPPGDGTVTTNIYDTTTFLYEGEDPVQTGVAEGTIDDQRVAVLRGKVLTKNGAPLEGVAITILNHPEYGQTLSRQDGLFDLALNGGGLAVVNYARAGYLPVQRKVVTLWKEYAWLEDVVMIPLDAQVTPVDLAASPTMQVVRGSLISDADGQRRATLLIPGGVTGEMVLPGGAVQALAGVHIRATEYTVGENGPQTMPGDLPPSSGYTYAVEFSVDEAMAAGATQVRFSQPLVNYLENYLGFPVGGIVPVGTYDREKGDWIPSTNGVVVQIVSITGGLADLDSNGDGAADSPAVLAALGVSDAERTTLAGLYTAGQTLWRVPVLHFTPFDCNWPFGCTGDCTPPNLPLPDDDWIDDPCEASGSIIGCQNQTLGEDVRLAGTDFSLHYASERTPGYATHRMVNIPLTGASLPNGLKYIELQVEVASQKFSKVFTDLTPNLQYTYAWDGRDGYGRLVQGSQRATIQVGYAYTMVYTSPANAAQTFGLLSGYDPLFTANQERMEVYLHQVMFATLRVWDSLSQGLGGWSLDILHSYDPTQDTLYLGNGDQRSVESLGVTITTVAGTGVQGFSGDGGPAVQAKIYQGYGVAVGPDGSLYFAEQNNYRVRRVSPDGIITTFAGGGHILSGNGDGGLAAEAKLAYPYGVAVAPDGSVYISTTGSVRRVAPDGIISTVAGMLYGSTSDGIPATQAKISSPYDIAIGPDGALYIADTFDDRVRRVGTDGIITTVAGTGIEGFSGDGGPARLAMLNEPYGIDVGPDGSLYIADTQNDRIRRVGPDGLITTIAGKGTNCGGNPCFSGDGGPAVEAEFSIPKGVAVGPDGTVYISDSGNYRVRMVTSDGVIRTLTGTGWPGAYNGDNRPPTTAFISVPYGLALDPAGGLYIFTAGYRIRRVAPQKGSGAELIVRDPEIKIASADGRQVNIFNDRGRHLRTLDALTSAVVYSFTYDAAGRLAAVADGDGNLTTIERDAEGRPTAILAPEGLRTGLAVDSRGYLAQITNPAGATGQYQYAANGLLLSTVDPRGGRTNFAYDSLGRLLADQNPAGGVQTLNRAKTAAGYNVTLTSPLGRPTTHAVSFLPEGGQSQLTTFPNGLITEWKRGFDTTLTTRFPNGMLQTLKLGPDPRWGMQAPVLTSSAVKTPAGLTATVETTRTATLTIPADPLSLNTLTQTIKINGRTTSSVYSAANRTYTTTSAAGRVVVVTVDQRSRPVQVQVGNRLPIRYTYDSRGRLATAATGDGTDERKVILTYNNLGFLASVTDPLGRSTAWVYDNAGRPTQQTLPDSRVIEAQYDALGNLLSLTPPGGSTHTFAYDALGQVTNYTPPDVNPGPDGTTYSYNADRQVVRVTRPDANQINLTYDAATRLSSLAFSRGALNFQYDPATGNPSTTAAPGGLGLTYRYDGSLLTGESWTGAVAGSVDYVYDTSFRVSGVKLNGGAALTYTYDNDSLATKAGSENLTYSPQTAQLTGTTLGSVTTAHTYTSFGEPLNASASYLGTPFFTNQYTYDKLGRITQKVETINGVTIADTYSYDTAGRLIGVGRNGAPVEAYTYDSNGNRLSFTGSGSPILSSYDAQDRLIQSGSADYTYTANGELLSRTVGGQTTTYSYDTLGNLAAVSLPGAIQVNYLVDAQGRRIGKTVNGSLVQGFLYQGQLNPVAELDGANQVVSRFVYASQAYVPDYMVKGGVTYRILTDQLGSPRLVVDSANGVVVQRMEYDAFGQVVADTNPGFQPFGFAGGLYDRHTGLTHFGARDYDAESGRWTAKDPLGFPGGDINLYGYVLNDPINAVDRTGFNSGLAIGFNISAGGNPLMMALPSFGFDAGVEIVIDFETGEFRPYLTIGTGEMIGVTAGAGLSVTGVVDIDNFFGCGREIGIDTPLIGGNFYGTPSNPDDIFGTGNGSGLSIGPTLGGGIHHYKTRTFGGDSTPYPIVPPMAGPRSRAFY